VSNCWYLHPTFGRGLLIADHLTGSDARYELDFEGIGRRTLPVRSVRPVGEPLAEEPAEDGIERCAGLALLGPPSPVRIDVNRDKIPADLTELLERWGPGWIGGEFCVLVPGDASYTETFRAIREDWAEARDRESEAPARGSEHAWTAIADRTFRRMLPVAVATSSRAVITYTRAPDEGIYFCDPDLSLAVRVATSLRGLVTWLIDGGLDTVATPATGARYGLPATLRSDGPYAGEEAELFRLALLSGERVEETFDEWIAAAPKWVIARELAELMAGPGREKLTEEARARWTERAALLARTWNPAALD
jgi:hypothetical protein